MFQWGTRHGWSPIDSAWATPDVVVSHSMYCTVDNSPGDHRAIILDVDLYATIGEPCYQVVRPPGHRLNCSLPNVQKSYVRLFETYAHSHCLEDKLCQIFHLASMEGTPRLLLKETMEHFDCIKAEGMRFAEKGCHWLHVGEVQFSPELNLWRQCRNLWFLVLKWKQGKKSKHRPFIN